MEFLNSLREKAQHRKAEEAVRLASEYITLSDFDDRIYIAFQDNPLIVIDEDWTAEDIMKKLQEVRDNYIESKIKN
jgi:hypothetical protein